MTEAGPVDTFDDASLEAFVSELVANGFEPLHERDRRVWTGPIHPAFARFTDAKTMRIKLRDGWPYEPPALFVSGLHTDHVNASGHVCLWQPDDASLRWLTVAGLFERIEEFCTNTESGWPASELALDANLSFENVDHTPVLFDLDALGTADGARWGDFHATQELGPGSLRWFVRLEPGRVTRPDELRGMWFHTALSLPPRTLDDVRTMLARPQRRALDRALERRKVTEAYRPSGGVDLVLLVWQRHGQRDALIVEFEGAGTSLTAHALLSAPSDRETLMRRAGPDASALSAHRIVIFGAGAIGGHAAVVLGESGVGSINVVDPDVLLPANVVRHVGSSRSVGYPKSWIVERVIADHAPWVTTDVDLANPRTPQELKTLFADRDLVVDATGNAAVTAAIAHVAAVTRVPLVSAALYRGGALVRIRRQGFDGDLPINERLDDPRYPTIPPASDGSDFAALEIGCSAPVHNAPPSAVMAAAALLAQVAIDALTGRVEFPDEVIEVYRTLPGTAFVELGRFRT